MHPAEALAQQLKPGRGWDQWLADEFRQPYMRQLAEFLAAEEQAGKVLYPPPAPTASMPSTAHRWPT